MSVTKGKSEEDEIEIRLSDIVLFLKYSRKQVIFWGLVFFIIGILYAFSQQNEYTSTVKVMPELKTSGGAGSSLGDLKSLAGLAGVSLGDLGSTSEAIRPDLYPDIVQSIPFSLHLLKQSVTTTTRPKPQTLETYLISKNESSFIGKVIVKLFGSSEDTITTQASTVPTLQLTRQQEALCKMINARISANMDKKSGIITITSQMPDAVVTATVARQTLDYLTTYVANYRTGKARQQVQFLTSQVNDARRRYEAMELQLSSYRDRNRSIFLNTAKIEEQRLQADYLLAQGVYSDLSKQLEQARIKEEEEAPVFQILEPAQVPLRKSSPKRLIIIIGFTILGVIVGLSTYGIRSFIRKQPINIK